MSVNADSLKAALAAAYPDATHVETIDLSGGCGSSFEIVVVSPSFEKKSTLARHRQGQSRRTLFPRFQPAHGRLGAVNSKIAGEIAQLHAFSQKTYTPAEYEKIKTKA